MTIIAVSSEPFTRPDEFALGGGIPELQPEFLTEPVIATDQNPTDSSTIMPAGSPAGSNGQRRPSPAWQGFLSKIAKLGVNTASNGSNGSKRRVENDPHSAQARANFTGHRVHCGRMESRHAPRHEGRFEHAHRPRRHHHKSS